MNEQEVLLESAIIANLELSPEQRLEAHQNALNLTTDLTQAGESLRAGSEETT